MRPHGFVLFWLRRPYRTPPAVAASGSVSRQRRRCCRSAASSPASTFYGRTCCLLPVLATLFANVPCRARSTYMLALNVPLVFMVG
jgi:hypothetical protein